MKFIILVIVLGLVGFVPAGHASEGLSWLSGLPPREHIKEFRPSGMQHYLAYRDRGTEKLVLWYRFGDDIQNARYLNATLTPNAQTLFYAPDLTNKDYKLENGRFGYTLSYNFDQEGYNNIYVIEKWIEKDVLRIHVAKAERLSHKCLNGHRKEKSQIKLKDIEGIPIDIVRLRKGDETLHLRHESGEIIDYKILVNGKAVKDANVEIISHTNWKKELVTNEAGIASIQLLADYFSKWKEFKRRATYHFLIKVCYEEVKIGTFEGQKYRKVKYSITLPGDYIPSKTWYQSNAWAAIIFFAAMLLFSLAIYVYRWKFKRPY